MSAKTCWTANGSSGSPQLAEAAEAIARALRSGALDEAARLSHGAHGAAMMVEEPSGLTLLHLACQAGDDISARMLLDHGADPAAASGPLRETDSGVQRSGPTPLMLAASSNSATCIRALAGALKNGTLEQQLDVRDHQGRSAFLIAARGGNAAALSLIAKLRPQAVFARNRHGENGAALASFAGSVDCLRTIESVAGEFSPIWTDGAEKEDGALMEAVKSRAVDCVVFLTNKALNWLRSSDPERVAMARSMMGVGESRSLHAHFTPLAQAAALNDDEIFEALLEPTLLAQPNAQAQARLLWGCLDRSTFRPSRASARLDALIEIAEEVAQAQRHLNDPAVGLFFNETMEAIGNARPLAPGCARQEQALIARLGAVASDHPQRFLQAMQTADAEGRGLLHEAADKGRARVMQTLLGLASTAINLGSQPVGQESSVVASIVNRRDLLGRSPLAVAAARGDERCALALLDAGGSSSLWDRHGWTPFARALEGGKLALVRRMEFVGAKASQNFAGQSVAFLDAPSAILEWLVEGGAPKGLFSAGAGGDCPLHAAARSGCIRRLRWALGHSKPNAKNHKGETALALAAQVGFAEGVEALLPFTDPSLTDNEGLSPLMALIARAPSEDPRQDIRLAQALGGWFDPRQPTPLGPRWIKRLGPRPALGPRAHSPSALDWAAFWMRSDVERTLQKAKNLWDQGQAPGQDAKAYANLDGADAIAAERLARSIGAARQAMDREAPSRKAKAAGP